MTNWMTSLSRSIVYGALDSCTAGRGVKRVVSGEPVRFKARWCRFYPSVYEPETFKFLRAHLRPGETALDIGAHIGLFSVLMARLVGPSGRVFSFEPVPAIRDILCETLRLNDCIEITETRGEAVASTTGRATFYDTGETISNAGSLIPTARSRSEFPVETVSVDDFAVRRGIFVHCLKIDAEGAELQILRGACRTLLACRPVVLLALHPTVLRRSGASLAEVWGVLQGHGMIALHDNRPVDGNWFCRQEDLVDVQILPQESAVLGDVGFPRFSPRELSYGETSPLIHARRSTT